MQARIRAKRAFKSDGQAVRARLIRFRGGKALRLSLIHIWTDVRRLLEGTAPYLWRVRCLRDGTLVVLASLYGTPWGPGRERATRNTMLPGETYQSKIQPFFLTSRDGREFSAPNYICLLYTSRCV